MNLQDEEQQSTNDNWMITES